MSPPHQPYGDKSATFHAFAARVSAGKARLYQNVGLDVVMGEREGAWFADAFDGKRYFNCHSNGGVFNLGHRNPAVIAAVRGALESLDIGNHHLVSGLRAALAERLARSTGDELPRVVFGVSGGEANDLAIKVCRAATRRARVVSASGGYHGHTGLSLAAGDPKYREPFRSSSPDFEQVPFDDLGALERAIDDRTAAVLLETIPATLGMPLPSPGYLAGVQRLCRERGAKLVLDEVQTGLGRTGKLWGYQHEGVVPDAITVGKGLSGGVYPIAATLMTPELHAIFEGEPFLHISTFGGAELGCAAATAVLDQIEAPGFLERVRALAEVFRAGLSGGPFELRQRGLFMGLKLPYEGGGIMATKQLYDAGVFAVYANNDPSVLQLLPPLIISDEQAAQILGIVRRVLG